MNDNSFVYFIRPVGMDGPIKIGSSYSPPARMRELRAWSPFPLEVAVAIPGDQDLERKVQNCFAASHSHGEWFHGTRDLLDAIDALQRGMPIGMVVDLDRKNVSVLGLIQKATRARNAGAA